MWDHRLRSLSLPLFLRWRSQSPRVQSPNLDEQAKLSSFPWPRACLRSDPVHNRPGRHSGEVVSVAVSEEDYVAALEPCRQADEALFVWVLDALDLPGSVFKPLVDALALQRQAEGHEGLQVILALNKMDLLPRNKQVSRGERWRTGLMMRTTDARKGQAGGAVVVRQMGGWALPSICDTWHVARCLQERQVRSRLKEFVTAQAQDLGVRVKAVHFVSAYTGEGLRGLFKDIQTRCQKRDVDAYLVGCTNVGKSSIVNRLLASAAKVSAVFSAIMPLLWGRTVSHRANTRQATTSTIPGTTLSLLKYRLSQKHHSGSVSARPDPTGGTVSRRNGTSTIVDTPGVVTRYQMFLLARC